MFPTGCNRQSDAFIENQVSLVDEMNKWDRASCSTSDFSGHNNVTSPFPQFQCWFDYALMSMQASRFTVTCNLEIGVWTEATLKLGGGQNGTFSLSSHGLHGSNFEIRGWQEWCVLIFLPWIATKGCLMTKWLLIESPPQISYSYTTDKIFSGWMHLWD